MRGSLLLFLALLPISSEAMEDQGYFCHDYLVTDKIQEWAPSKFSNPREHNSKKFRYIIHTVINPFYFFSKTERIEFDFLINIVSNPNFLKTHPALSASVITQEFRVTSLNAAGFILKVPAENIIATAPEDMQIHNSRHTSETELRKEISRVQMEYGIKSPDEILNPGLNEVLTVGTMKDGSSIEIIGVLVDSKEMTNPVDLKYLELLKETGARLELPVIDLGLE